MYFKDIASVTTDELQPNMLSGIKLINLRMEKFT